MNTKFYFRALVTILLLVFVHTTVVSQTIKIESKELVDGKPKNTIGLGGYVKLTVASDYLGLPNTNWYDGSSFNMIEIPTVGDVENRTISFNAWQSRIKLSNTYLTEKNEKIFAYIEGDFHNAGRFRLRHAYVNFKNWTIGHTTSTFANNDVWVNISDFDGPPVGVFARRPQVRYTVNCDATNQLNFALEEPKLDTNRPEEPDLNKSRLSEQTYIPDVVANYRHQFKGGTFQLSAVGRLLSHKTGYDRETTYGYGAMFNGTFSLLKKDLFIYQALAGKGIEHYLMGLEGYGLDAVTYQNKLKPLPVYGGYLAYQHYWNSNLNSSIMYGYQKVEDKFYATDKNAFTGNYYSANLFFNAIENVLVGFEFIYGDKKVNYLDEKGRNNRFYFTLEYSF